jgi:hypothetical protein
VLRWAYSKDGTVSAGRDAGWLDEVVFTPAPAPQLTLTAPRLLSGGGIAVCCRDADGAVLALEDFLRFEAQASTNLVGWITLADALTLTNGSLLLRDPASANEPARFYRVVEH